MLNVSVVIERESFFDGAEPGGVDVEATMARYVALVETAVCAALPGAAVVVRLGADGERGGVWASGTGAGHGLIEAIGDIANAVFVSEPFVVMLAGSDG